MIFNKSVNLKVNGMHCGGCAGKIKKSLEDLKIQHTVDVDVESGHVKIQFNSSESDVATLKASILKSGFQVESIELL